jgi:hypothetical protein
LVKKELDQEPTAVELGPAHAPGGRPWQKPRLESLPLAGTRGGFIMTMFEGPFNIFFGTS